MTRITLPRTGLPPLAFDEHGSIEVSGKWHAGRDCNRWHDLNLWNADGGRYVLHIAYRTQWQGELGKDTVTVCADTVAVIKALKDYDPLADAGNFGYPAHVTEHNPRLAAKQAERKADLKARWDDRVSELLGLAGITEELS